MENQVITKSEELQLMEAKQKAEFAMTPIGRMVHSMEAVNQVANFYAKSDFVPMTFKGKQENCAIAVDMAIRMNMNPIMVMQNMYVVHGQPSLSSKLIIAMINNCGQFEPLRWEGNGKEGQDFGMRAWTYRKNDTEHQFRLESSWVTFKMATAEGWGAKWKTMPEQMFRYRTAVFWARTHAPEVTMGLLAKDEVEEPSFIIENPTEETKSAAELAMEKAMSKAIENKPTDVIPEPQEAEVVPAVNGTANPKAERSLV